MRDAHDSAINAGEKGDEVELVARTSIERQSINTALAERVPAEIRKLR